MSPRMARVSRIVWWGGERIVPCMDPVTIDVQPDPVRCHQMAPFNVFPDNGVIDARTCQERAGFVKDSHVVVVAGPTRCRRTLSLASRFVFRLVLWLVFAVQGMRVPHGRARWPDIRIVVHDFSGRRDPRSEQELEGSRPRER